MMNNLNALELFIGLSFTMAGNSHWRQLDYAILVSEATKYNAYIETIKSPMLPDPDRMHERIEEQTITVYHENFLRITCRQLEKLRIKKAMLVIDYTHEPFYGSTTSYWIHGYRPKNGCTGSFCILSASILVDNHRHFVDSIPVGILTDTTKAVEKILDKVGQVLDIEAVLLDRGFASKAVIEVLEARKLRYLILCPKWVNIKKIINSLKGGYGRIKLKVGNADTMLILKHDEKGFWWSFLTNMGLYHFTRYVIEYRKRWNIETGFRVQDEARIKTKSTGITVRYFLFVASMVLYNIWKFLAGTGYRMQFKKFVINFWDVVGVDAADTVYT